MTRVGTELFLTTCALLKGVLRSGVPAVKAVDVGDILPAALPEILDILDILPGVMPQRCDWLSIGDVLEVVQHLRPRHLLPISEREN